MRTAMPPSVSPIVSHSSMCKQWISMLMIWLVLLVWAGVL